MRILNVSVLVICLSVSVALTDTPTKWTLYNGTIITGEYRKHYDDTVEVADSQGKVIKIDITQLSIEDARILYPALTQEDISKWVKPIQGLDSPQKRKEAKKKADETVLKRTKFINISGTKYGRLYAYSTGYYYFEALNGGLLWFSQTDIKGDNNLKGYLEYFIRQIPGEFNAKRLKVLEPIMMEKRIRDLEQRVENAEGMALDALRREEYNTRHPDNPIPPGASLVNGTWVIVGR